VHIISEGLIIIMQAKEMGLMKYLLLVAACAGLLGLGVLTLRGELTISQEGLFVVRVPHDFPTIQQAIDAVAEGGTVLIGAGLYKENLVITKSIHLRGAGQERVQILYADHKLPIVEIVSEAWVQVSIQDMTIGDPTFPIEQVTVPPAPTGPQPVGTGLSVNAPLQLLLKQVTIAGLALGIDGFSLRFSSQLVLHSVKLARNSVGLMITHTHLLVSYSQLEENIHGGVISVHGGQLLVSHSSFDRNRIVGMALALGGLYLSWPPFITDSEFKQNGTGLLLSNGKEGNVIWIVSNRFVGNERYGVAISDPACPIVNSPIALPTLPLLRTEGGNNEFQNNGQDLCPADYPWPPGFRK
jgi:hypothetical protein